MSSFRPRRSHSWEEPHASPPSQVPRGTESSGTMPLPFHHPRGGKRTSSVGKAAIATRILYFCMGTSGTAPRPPPHTRSRAREAPSVTQLSPVAEPAERSSSLHTSISLTPVLKLSSCISIYCWRSVRRVQISRHYF